jgi:hypothetical protein
LARVLPYLAGARVEEARVASVAWELHACKLPLRLSGSRRAAVLIADDQHEHERLDLIGKCQLTFYTQEVSARFKHKGLQLLFEEDDGRRVKADQIDRLRLILSALGSSE